VKTPLLAILVTGLLAYSTTATCAEEGTPEPVPVAVQPATRTMALTVNPLPAIFGQWGVNAEYSAALHHSAVVSLAYVYMDDDLALKPAADGGASDAPPPSSASSTFYAARVRGCAGEIGYRYYTDAKAMKGLFLSPSLLIAGGTAHGGQGTRSFGSYGAAFDVGGQMVTSSGFVIAAGLGVYGLVGRNMNSAGAASTWTKSGIAPRLLLSVGWAI
jgi:hypothetical protein